MKIKFRTLVMLGIIYCITCQNKWLIIMGLDHSIWFHIERILYVVLFLYCRFSKKNLQVMKPYYKAIDKGLLIVLLVGIIEFIYTIISRRAGFQVAIENSVYAYMKLLAVYPLLYLFVCGGYKKVQKTILFICGSSMIYQAFVAILFNTKGLIISESLITNDEWIRNGNIRLGSTCLIWVIFIIWFCKAINEKQIYKKSGNIFWSIFTIIFMLFVNQSRALYVAAIGAVLLVYLFHGKKDKGKIATVFALLVFVILFTQSSVFNNFIASFSKGTVDDTLTGRLELLGLIGQTSRSTLFGFGFVGSTVEIFSRIFYFSDYGLIGDLLQVGIFAATLYLVTVIILLRNAIKLSKHKGFGFDFTVGALGFVFIGIIGFTVLSPSRNFAIPIILAISQYYAINYMQEQGQIR